MPAATPPIVLCLLVCDSVHLDPESGKRFLLGTITELHLDSQNAGSREVWVYTELTNGHGATPLDVRISRTDGASLEGSEVLRATFSLGFPEPRDVVYLSVRLAGSLFSRGGEYWITLVCGGLPLAERRLGIRGTPTEGFP